MAILAQAPPGRNYLPSQLPPNFSQIQFQNVMSNFHFRNSFVNKTFIKGGWTKGPDTLWGQEGPSNLILGLNTVLTQVTSYIYEAGLFYAPNKG